MLSNHLSPCDCRKHLKVRLITAGSNRQQWVPVQEATSECKTWIYTGLSVSAAWREGETQTLLIVTEIKASVIDPSVKGLITEGYSGFLHQKCKISIHL